MRIKLRNEFILLNVLVLALVVSAIFSPSSALRVIFGLPFLLFLPGYTFMTALFPRREELKAIERIALSFGLSIIVVSLIGFILNYTPWGIRLEPILFSVTLFTVITSVVGYIRRVRLAEPERFYLKFPPDIPRWGKGKWAKALSIILGVTIIGFVGTLVYVIATPKAAEKFTEFYIVGQNGKAIEYPSVTRLGEKSGVIVAIVNHERGVTNYLLEVWLDKTKINEVKSIVLANEEKWEQTVELVPNKLGDNQKLEFLLYKNKEEEPSLRLHLWVDVRE